MIEARRTPHTFHEEEDPSEVAFRILEEEGVHAVLGFLNARVEHRFTGLYRFDPPVLRNVLIYDRENPGLRIAPDAPLEETYCSIVGRTEEPFHTRNSHEDDRVRDHAARDSVRAYTGVLLEDDEGRPFGTLCHFDHVPCEPATDDLALLQRLAPALRAALESRED